ncbi:MAG TPA: hypothetical protein VG937_11345 [Polyangiaceae bacterium]|nr:hypothetical protein [Polyangiaceae bacterium]
MFRAAFRLSLGLCLAVSGCSQSHTALVRTQALPPPPEPAVQHARPLWLELSPGVSSTQCVEPKDSRKLCFAEVDAALETALSRALWTSFPRVQRLGYSDVPAPGDYVLSLDLSLQTLPPSAGGPGWAALAKGRFRITRDGRELGGESVESRSRADFAYGRALGTGAGEVVDAIALHVGMALGKLPETRPDHALPLPAVVAQPLPAPAHPIVATTK